LAPRGLKVHKVFKVCRGQKALKVIREIQVHEGLSVRRVKLDHRDRRACRDRLVRLARKDQKAQQV
jgi:hypothetical protein